VLPNFRRLAVVSIAVAGLGLTSLACGTTTPARVSAPTATRGLVGAFKNPIGAKGRTLGLSIVTIPTGVKLPLHYHEGTQVAYIEQGILLYSVKAGSVRVMRGLADQGPTLVRTISAGQTGAISAGEWIVEQPSVHHSAQAKVKVVVLLASLLRNGAPPATPLK
jgi:quercetin dioxygenase-like cupin family protein